MVALPPSPPSPTPTPRPVRIAVLTVSDTRTAANDTSGDLLVERLSSAGHTLAARDLVQDDRAILRARILDWSAARSDDGSPAVEAILITGGTGITGRDVTVDVLEPLFEKAIPGFGELFRMLSYADIGASTIQSRAVAGLVGTCFVFAMPGSTGACRLAWDAILAHQLDVRAKPCNLVKLMPRLDEGPPETSRGPSRES
ncbi:MAG: molybdenum cofactor biosynthesis protein B [Deltaproteobacteria bacterium]|nr:molybdenum cofactor biosynthesis protein B [Deltaproteobacteria bacterium]